MFGRYELLDRIGLGGMAEVWRARVGGVGGFEKIVVIKKILPSFASNRTFIDMLLAEARLCAVLQHANVVQTYENGEIDGIFYIAMEYVPGHDLFKVLSRATQTQFRIPPEICLLLTAEVAKGLHYAHNAKDHYGRSLNIIHRDVSPSNVIISESGEVKVMDFGVAKATPGGERENATRSGVLKGKLGYMSPEQVTGRPFDHRSDIFSLGIILYESLTLKRLFLAKTDLETLVNIRDARIEHKFKKHAYIEEDIREILRRALARDPDERYPTALAMHDDIMKVLFARRQHVSAGHLVNFMTELFDPSRAPQTPPQPTPQGPPTRPDAPAAPRPGSAGAMAIAGLALNEVRAQAIEAVLGPDSAPARAANRPTGPALVAQGSPLPGHGDRQASGHGSAGAFEPGGDEPPPIPGHLLVNQPGPTDAAAGPVAAAVAVSQAGLAALPGSNSLSFSPGEMQKIRERIAEKRSQQGVLVGSQPIPEIDAQRATVPVAPPAEAPSAQRPQVPPAQSPSGEAVRLAPSQQTPAVQRHLGDDRRVHLGATQPAPFRHDWMAAAKPGSTPGFQPGAPTPVSGLRGRPAEFAVAAPESTDPAASAARLRAMRPELQTAPHDVEAVAATLPTGGPVTAPSINALGTTGLGATGPADAQAPGRGAVKAGSTGPGGSWVPLEPEVTQDLLDSLSEVSGLHSPIADFLDELSQNPGLGVPNSLGSHAYGLAGQPADNMYRVKLADGTAMGPLSLANLESLLRARTLTAAAMVALGDGSFEPITAVPALRTVLAETGVRGKQAVLSGPLSQWILVRLIYRLCADRSTGCLELQRADALKSIFFRRGRVQYIASNQMDELLGPFMVSNGYVSQADVDQAAMRAKQTGGKLGDLLISMNKIKPFQLFQVLEQQMRAKFIDAFGWDSGTFSFYDAVDPPPEIVPLDVDPVPLLAEGVRDRVTLAVVEPMLADKLDRRLYQVRNPQLSVSALKLHSRESKALSLLLTAETARPAYLECYANRQQRLALLHVLLLLLQTDLLTFDPDRA